MNPARRLSSAFIFVSVFFGSIMGAGISMLSAPTSGKELRNKIKDISNMLKENIQKIINNSTRRLAK